MTKELPNEIKYSQVAEQFNWTVEPSVQFSRDLLECVNAHGGVHLMDVYMDYGYPSLEEVKQFMAKKKTAVATKLWQLSLEYAIDKEWEGTVWRSDLYTSKRNCIIGCCQREIALLADVLATYTDTEEELEAKQAKYLKKVKDWLQGAEEMEFVYRDNDDQAIYWRVREYAVAE